MITNFLKEYFPQHVLNMSFIYYLSISNLRRGSNGHIFGEALKETNSNTLDHKP